MATEVTAQQQTECVLVASELPCKQDAAEAVPEKHSEQSPAIAAATASQANSPVQEPQKNEQEAEGARKFMTYIFVMRFSAQGLYFMKRPTLQSTKPTSPSRRKAQLL